MEFRNRTLLITLKLTYTDTIFFVIEWKDPGKKNLKWNNSVALLQTLLAISTGNWKFKGGQNQPCLEIWELPAGEGKENTSTPTQRCLCHRGGRRAQSSIRRTRGTCRTPFCRFMDQADLQSLHAKRKNVAVSKCKSLPPIQMWAEVWPKRKIRSSVSRLALSERKPNTMQPVHSIFFIAVLRAAIQCFPIKNKAIYHWEAGVSRKHFHYLCYGKEATKRTAKRWQTVFMRLDFRPSQGWPALLFHSRKKVIGFSYVGLIQQEGASTLWLQDTQTKPNENIGALSDPQAV